jgi:hypothetical protein
VISLGAKLSTGLFDLVDGVFQEAGRSIPAGALHTAIIERARARPALFNELVQLGAALAADRFVDTEREVKRRRARARRACNPMIVETRL